MKTVPETAAHLKVAPITIWRMIERGELVPNRFGRAVRISDEEIERLKRETLDRPKAKRAKAAK